MPCEETDGKAGNRHGAHDIKKEEAVLVEPVNRKETVGQFEANPR